MALDNRLHARGSRSLHAHLWSQALYEGAQTVFRAICHDYIHLPLINQWPNRGKNLIGPHGRHHILHHSRPGSRHGARLLPWLQDFAQKRAHFHVLRERHYPQLAHLRVPDDIHGHLGRAHAQLPDLDRSLPVPALEV